MSTTLRNTLWTKSGIKGGSWLTVLGDAYVSKLGGAAWIQQALGTQFSLTPYPRGIIIKAGEAPEIGDRHEHIATPLLTTLARILEPIRVTSHPGVRISSQGYGTQEFERWLRRFDEP